MTAYGFRLHKITAHAGLSRPELDLSDVGDGSATQAAIDALMDRLDALVGTTIVGSPTYAQHPSDLVPSGPTALPRNTTRPYMYVRFVNRSGRRIKVTLDYGREGDYNTLLDNGGAPRPMDGLAASRTFRVWFLVPPSGKVAYMVSEVKGQSFAGEALLDRLRVENQRAVCSVRGGDLLVGHFVRWRHEPLFDGSRINDIFNGADNFEIELRRVGHTRTGAPTSGDVKITEYGLDSAARVQQAVGAVRGWWQNRANGTKQARSEQAARDLGTLIDLNVNFAQLGFNDGEVRFTQQGKVQRINPNKIEKLYVYPVGTSVPSDRDLTSKAAARLDNVNRDLSLNIDLSDLTH